MGQNNVLISADPAGLGAPSHLVCAPRLALAGEPSAIWRWAAARGLCTGRYPAGIPGIYATSASA